LRDAIHLVQQFDIELKQDLKQLETDRLQE